MLLIRPFIVLIYVLNHACPEFFLFNLGHMISFIAPNLTYGIIITRKEF